MQKEKREKGFMREIIFIGIIIFFILVAYVLLTYSPVP